MKVRRTRESLRLRIAPTELRSLFAGESVCERSGLREKPRGKSGFCGNLTSNKLQVRFAESTSSTQLIAAIILGKPIVVVASTTT